MSERDPRLSIGANRGPAPMTPAEIPLWLTDEYAGLLQRRRELVDGLAAFAAKHPEITTEDQSAAATENVNMVRKALVVVEDQRVQAKEPFLQGGRAVDRWFAEVKTSLQDAASLIAPALKAYLEAKEERKRAEAAAEAKRLADLADEAARAAEASGRFDDAVEVAKDAEQAAALAEGKPGPLTRTVGTYGSTSSLQETTEFEVVDPELVPREFCPPSHQLIRHAIRNGRRDIPGVRIFTERKLRTR